MQIQRVDLESRVYIDIETDDIPVEVARLEKLGAKAVGISMNRDSQGTQAKQTT